VGTYFDSTFATHGFVRGSDGTITSFDVPGFLVNSNPPLITAQGVVVGLYFDANGSHIFERAKDGTITTLEIPDPGAFIVELVANSAGGIAGELFDANGLDFFLRAPSGKFTLIPVPPALIPPPMPFSFDPNITALTPGGTILGSYFDENLALHGFLRTVDGTFTTFDVPNALADFPFQGTIPASINNSGMVSGFYFDTTHNSELRVFLRAVDGTFSSSDTPQLGSFGGAASINSSGAVAGNVQNTICTPDSCSNVPISFLRAANGKVSSVNDPEAAQGTQVLGLNPAGVIFGVYSDANNVQHGFVEKP